MIKKYYKIQFKLLEPLSLGNGENKFSDCDILRDSRGVPFIPGSSLCGAYRSCFDEDIAEKYFGKWIDPNKDANQSESNENGEESGNSGSSIIVYDAVYDEKFEGNKYAIEIRDSVGLDEFKVAKDGAKFDFELVQPGAVFVTYIEQNMKTDDIDIGSIIAQKMFAGEFYLGHKSMRGYGKVQAVDVWCKEFDLPEPDDENLYEELQDVISSWISFDMYEDDAFAEEYKSKEEESVTGHIGNGSKQILLKLTLKQQGGISIREYTTDLTDNGKNQPDYVQMHYGEGSHEEPFIPGTTWSGAFRHHIDTLLSVPKCEKEEIIKEYFGFSEKKKNKKSKIRFSESIITGASPKIIMRNAIDRFTGGTVDGALYTEKTFFGGKTTLNITLQKPSDEEDQFFCLFCKALAASIADLDAGILSIGGLTSVGRGLFKVEKCECNNESLDWDQNSDSNTRISDKLYKALIKAMGLANSVAGSQEEVK